MSGQASLIRGNALRLPLRDRSVHLALSSPPYWSLRQYSDSGDALNGQLGSEPNPWAYLANLWAVMDEVWRVLRDDGSCFLNLGDKFAGSGGHNNAGISKPHTGGSGASRRNAPDRYNQHTGGLRAKTRMGLPHRFYEGCVDPEYRQWTEQRAGLPPTETAPQWVGRMDIVWAKANGLPESVSDRVRASHEYVFHLTKNERYYASVDEIREPADSPPSFHRKNVETRSSNKGTNHRALGFQFDAPNPLGKLPGSVWEIASEPLIVPEYMIMRSAGDMRHDWLMTTPDAWQWAVSAGVLSSPWPRGAGEWPQLWVAPDHFAAWPSDLAKRIIAGWSPPGVCTVCGQGRRPVSEKTLVLDHMQRRTTSGLRDASEPDSNERGINRREPTPNGRTEARIVGYACACPDASAPTTPATVLDWFSGTGTTAAVANALGRHGVGVELSADYNRLATWRTNDPGLRAKVLGVDKPARQVDGQGSLFDGLAS